MHAQAEPQRPSTTIKGCSVAPKIIPSNFQRFSPPSNLLYPDDSKPLLKSRAEREYPPVLDGEQLALPQDGMFYRWIRLHYGLTRVTWRPLLLPPPQLQRDISLNVVLRMSRSLRREFSHSPWNPYEPR